MGKKKFDKNSGQKFYIMHRSMMDEAYAQEGVPSDFVLVPANEAARSASLLTEGHGDASLRTAGSSNLSKRVKDHINELGFVNDGYDYSQHLREIGGGKFIDKEGREMDYRLPAPIELPEDVLPSAGQLERGLEAITISHELMDEDLKAALFEGFDEEGGFEELGDDFVALAMGGEEGEAGGFDFDAHIQSLILKSEDMLGLSQRPRGWDGDEARGLRAYHRDWGDEEGEEEDEEGEEGGQWEEGEAPLLLKGEREALERQFEQTLRDYEEGQIGPLDEEEEEGELEGELEVGDGELEGALEEFLAQEREKVYAEGRLVRKGARDLVLVREGEVPRRVGGWGDGQEEGEGPSNGVDVKREYEEQLRHQLECMKDLEDMDDCSNRALEEREIVSSQAYLSQEREELEWDCESIRSTYSTLSHHPTTIRSSRGAKALKQPYFRNLAQYEAYEEYRREVGEEGGREEAEGVWKGRGRRGGEKKAPPSFPSPSSLPSTINLKGRLSLPEGFEPGGKGKLGGSGKGRGKEGGKGSSGGIETIAEDDGEEEVSEEEETEGETSEEEEGEKKLLEGEEEGGLKGGKGRGGRETAEEKKARKAAIKALQREKRQQKKMLKLAFKEERGRIVRQVGREQGTDRHTVFNYT